MDVTRVANTQPGTQSNCFSEAILPRPLMAGEIYCHPCGKFLSSTDREEHQRYHTQRARMLALQ